jgi:malonyl-CoA/methylmalonyl-CoA synthetase
MESHPSAGAWWRHLGRVGSVELLLEELGRGSIPSVAHATAKAHPSREAVRVGDKAISHGDLDDGARRVASYLTGLGAGPGRCVLLAATNSLEYVVAYLGILHCGAAVVLVNPMSTPRELQMLVDDSEPVASLCDAARVDQLSEIGLAKLVSLQGDGKRSLSEVLTQSRPSPVREAEPDAVAHLAFTSGTTGRPKPTPLSHRNILSSVRSVVLSWRIDSDDVLVHGLPLQHAHGLSGLQAVLLSGCRGVFMPQFDPAMFCKEVESRSGTVLLGVPVIWDRLVASGELGRPALATARLAVSGSAPLSPGTFDEVFELTGQRLLERYGCTESGLVLSNPLEGERRPGHVGFALPGADVVVVDPAGKVVDNGDVGEIVARGPSVFSGYLGREKDEGSFFEEEWFRTGDLALVDPDDGYVRIVGRSKEMIITGGLNVYPREVELVLESIPGVAEAAVVGVPSSRWGEEVVAFLVPSPGERVDVAKVVATVEPVLAAYKRPKSYKVVEALPRNHLGKVLRSSLTSSLVAQAAANSKDSSG